MSQPETLRTASDPRIDPAVTTVRVIYPDLHGIARGKDVPVGELDRVIGSGLCFCAAVMSTDLRHTPVIGGDAGYPDLHAHPDLDTLVDLPWEPGVAQCIADLKPSPAGVPIADPRGLVRSAVAQLEELGLAPQVGPELEFFLLDREGNRIVDQLSMVYTVGPQVDPGGLVRRLTEQLQGMGLGAFAANHEFMNSQYEINLSHSGAVDAADRAFRLKAAVKDVAAINGIQATFMGKPFNDQGGSGFHLHLSLEREGVNAFDDADGADGVSPELRHFVAGILHHAAGLTALLNPTINAYRRLVPDSLAPTHVGWGWDNRSTLIRIPPERGGATRVEVRSGDGTANPYLAVGALLLAGLHGLRESLEPPAPVPGDAYRAVDAGPPLPASLEAALDALEADDVLMGALGAEITEPFLAMKRFEVERHRAWTSDWERDEYLRHL